MRVEIDPRGVRARPHGSTAILDSELPDAFADLSSTRRAPRVRRREQRSALLGRRQRCAEATATFFLVLIGPGAVVIDALVGGRSHDRRHRHRLRLGGVRDDLPRWGTSPVPISTRRSRSPSGRHPAVPAARSAPISLAQCAGSHRCLVRYPIGLRPGGQPGRHDSAGPARGRVRRRVAPVVDADARDHGGRDGRAGGPRKRGPGRGCDRGSLCPLRWPAHGSEHEPGAVARPRASGGLWTGHWIYWLAPISAMMVAAWGYGRLRRAESPRLHSTRVPLGVEGPLDLGTGTTADAPTPSGSPIASASSRSSPRGG